MSQQDTTVVGTLVNAEGQPLMNQSDLAEKLRQESERAAAEKRATDQRAAMEQPERKIFEDPPPAKYDDVLATYVSKQSPTLRLKITKKRTIQFENGVFRAKSKEDVERIDELIFSGEYPHISQQVGKLNRDEAEAVAREHIRMMQDRRTRTAKGPFTSESAGSALRNAVLADRETRLQAMGLAQGDIAKLRDELGADTMFTQESTGREVVRNEELQTFETDRNVRRPVPETPPVGAQQASRPGVDPQAEFRSFNFEKPKPGEADE